MVGGIVQVLARERKQGDRVDRSRDKEEFQG